MLPLPSRMGRVLRPHDGVDEIPGILFTATRRYSSILRADGQTPSFEHAKRARRNARHSETGK